MQGNGGEDLATKPFTEAIEAASAALDAKRTEFGLKEAREKLSQSGATAAALVRDILSEVTEVQTHFNSGEFAATLQDLKKSCEGSTGAIGCLAGCLPSRQEREAQVRKIEVDWTGMQAKITDCMADVQASFDKVGQTFEDFASSTKPVFDKLHDLPEELTSSCEGLHTPEDVLNFDIDALREATDVSAVTSKVSTLNTVTDDAEATLVGSKTVLSEASDWFSRTRQAIKKVLTPSRLEGCLVSLNGGKATMEQGNAAVKKLDGMAQVLNKLLKSLGSVPFGTECESLKDAAAPLTNYSKFASEKLDSMGEAQEAVKKACEAMHNIAEVGASFGTTFNSVTSDLKKGHIRGAASAAKGMVAGKLQNLAADGRESRGADRDDKYKFGDLARGARQNLFHSDKK